MWQDDYISKRDNDFVCWDHLGEFIATCSDRESARATITEYSEIIKRKYYARSLQKPIGIVK